MKLFYLTVLTLMLVVTLAKSTDVIIQLDERPNVGCWILDYDTAKYMRCEDANMSLNAAWKEFYDAPTWDEKKES